MEISDDVVTFIQTNGNAIAVALGVIAVGLVLSGGKFQDYLRGYKMKKQRRNEVQTILADAFTEVIMDKIALKQITIEEGREEGYLRLKRAYPECKDLYPSETLLKERIEKRVGIVQEPLQQLSDRTPVAEPVAKLMFQRRK